MGKFIKGDVVVLPFPFSDLSQSKRRPALVLVNLDRDDIILSQITSQSIYDSHAVKILEGDFDDGTLNKPSNIRPNKLFTADEGIILYKIGHINESKIQEVTAKVISIFTEE
ncbi:type II toxin-antitoxin system PemK/MazF family toxin [Clostridium sp.]|uniref:type II toxin-antitoxin system PemK/MazF family toxin n=1 Tax=Clostridium sp. TaxID=1506 RepID=UPI003D6CD7EF